MYPGPWRWCQPWRIGRSLPIDHSLEVPGQCQECEYPRFRGDSARNEIANVADGGLGSGTVVEMAAPCEQGVFIEGVQEDTAGRIKEIGIWG